MSKSGWLHTHDERWSFVIPYILLAILLSMFLSLFWLAVVIGLHGLIEIIRLAPLGGPWPLRVLSQLQLDFSLLLFALTLDVYLGWLFGIAGLGNLGKAGAALTTRAAGWQQGIRSFCIAVDDLLHCKRFFGKKSAATPDHAVVVQDCAVELQRFPAILGGSALLLILLAPWVTGSTVEDVWATILHAMMPFPHS